MPEADLPESQTDLATRTRDLFLREENTYGCAETALVALQEHYSLPGATDSSSAMAMNGGVAYSGGPCGALTGAAIAVGRLAAERVDDHREAKGVSRRIIQQLMTEFEERFSSTDCRDLTGYDMLTNHDAFLEEGSWRTTCMAQIEFAVDRLAPLVDPDAWDAELARQASL